MAATKAAVMIIICALFLLVGFAVGRATAAAGAPPPERAAKLGVDMRTVKNWDKADQGNISPIPDRSGSGRNLPDPLGPTHTLRGGGNPAPVAVRRGTASFVAASYGPLYLALPAGPGHRVRACGAGGCITRTSTDAGPSLSMQRAGRIVDLSLRDWVRVCGRPAVYGLCEVVVSDLAP